MYTHTKIKLRNNWVFTSFFSPTKYTKNSFHFLLFIIFMFFYQFFLSFLSFQHFGVWTDPPNVTQMPDHAMYPFIMFEAIYPHYVFMHSGTRLRSMNGRTHRFLKIFVPNKSIFNLAQPTLHNNYAVCKLVE